MGVGTQTYTITIPNNITDRFERKFYVANVIGNTLYDQLYDIDTNEDK